MNRGLYVHACKAAAAALCLPNANFHELHDTFFNNQDKFPAGFVDSFIAQNNIQDCVNSTATQDHLKKLIMSTEPVGIRSTPTFLLNGVKFEGTVPFYKFKVILDSLLAQPAQ